MQIHSILILAICLLLTKTQQINNFDLSQGTEEQEYQEFSEWKSRLNKNYNSKDEEDYRFKVFEQNTRKIKAHNSEEDSTYKMGLNQFSDLSEEEFSAIYLINLSGFILEDKVNQEINDERKQSSSDFILHKHHQKKSYENKHTETQFLEKDPPASLDLRQFGGIGPIRDQMQCGSCWAFSACVALEFSLFRFQGYHNLDLSEQYLVDCVYAHSNGYRGCEGGWMQQAFIYFANNGIVQEKDYPYIGWVDNCKASSVPRKYAGIKTQNPFVQVASDDQSIKKALFNHGVLSVCVDATDWYFYSSGIFRSKHYSTPECSHAVAIIGYGISNNVPYWIIRNSWNTWWGEEGYMRLDARRDSAGKIYGGIMLEEALYPNYD